MLDHRFDLLDDRFDGAEELASTDQTFRCRYVRLATRGVHDECAQREIGFLLNERRLQDDADVVFVDEAPVLDARRDERWRRGRDRIECPAARARRIGKVDKRSVPEKAACTSTSPTQT